MKENQSSASIHPLVLTPVSFQYEDKVTRYGHYRTTRAAEEGLDGLLDPYSRSAAEVLHELATAVERMGSKPPWVTIFLPKQYPLTGHFLSVRESQEQLSLSFYEHWSGKPGEYLEVGILTVWNKMGLKKLAKRCPYLWGAWGALSHLSESKSWLILGPEPEFNWLWERAAEDAYIHFLLRSLEKRRCSATQSLEFKVDETGGETCLRNE